MAFWSGSKLRLALSKKEIVRPYHPDKIDCSAYTLTLGPEYFVTPDFESKSDSSLKKFLSPGDWAAPGAKKPYKLGQGNFSIPPGQFAFLLTEEELSIPYNVMGFISLKSTVKWSGLINVSGFHVDPGFRGRLVYSVYNAGPSPIHLERGQDLFLLWLADLDDGAKITDSRIGKKPQTSISIDLISRVDRPIHSLQGLSDKIESLSRDLDIFKRVTYTLGAVAGLAAGLWKLLDVTKP